MKIKPVSTNDRAKYHEKKKVDSSIKIKFEPRDAWIGCYWNIEKNKLDQTLKIYICIIPFFPIIFTFLYYSVFVCKRCYFFGKKNYEYEKECFDTGDGLGFQLFCGQCDDSIYLEWPFKDKFVSYKQVIDAGFKIL